MIFVDMNKARAIGHEMRRAARDKEFAPHDEVIAKQIPGLAAGAEAARQAIRDKYVVIQGQIDAATSPEEIKASLGI